MSEIKNVVALDIETCPVAIGNIPVDNIKYLLEKSKSKRTQKIIDVEKIDDEKGKVVVGPGSIGMPELNRVVCVCTYDGEGYDIAYWVDLDLIDEKTIILLDVFEDEHEQVCRWDDEGEMLSHVLDIIKFNQKIVTFNGNSFDLKYIALRSLLNGIRKIPVPLNIKPWDCDGKWYDIRMALAGQYGVGDLAYWCRVFGVKPPEWRIEKDKIQDVWRSGDVRELLMGCQDDVRATWELGMKLMGGDE